MATNTRQQTMTRFVHPGNRMSIEKALVSLLGSGLGHVILMASICTSAHCAGIELGSSYVSCALNSASSLNLNNATFIQADVRTADFSGGTVFYIAEAPWLTAIGPL